MNPAAEQISGQAEKLAARVTGWQTHTYERIGRRVKEIGEMSAADVKTLNNLQTVSGDMDAILAELAAVTSKNVSELRDMYAETLSVLHLENHALYDHRGLSFVPPEQNETINALVNAYARTTAGSFENLAASGAKRIGFVDADGRFTPLEIDYKRILDKATVSIASGAEDFHTAMRDVLRDIGGSGVRVDYGGGVTRRADSAVRQNLLWGAKQASLAYNEKIGEELGCDGIEIDWHSNPRPSHEFMQGKQFSLSGEKTVDGVTYESADAALAALADYGCLHIPTPIILGVSVPTYSEKELARLNAENARQIEVDGVRGTGYEWKQAMRRLETEARYTHESAALLRASGDREGARQLQTKLDAIGDKYDRIAEKTGIKAQRERMTVVRGGGVDKAGSKPLTNVEKSGIIQSQRVNALNVTIDKFTPCLENSATGELVSTSYSLMSKKELGTLKGWKFNWSHPDLKDAEVYKLTIKGDSEIQGLIALTKFERDKAIYVNIAESARTNMGKNRNYSGVGGHLFAIAAQRSMDLGYGGFVFMDAKNVELVEHYRKSLGAILLGRPHPYRMFIDEDAAQRLLDIYTLEEET